MKPRRVSRRTAPSSRRAAPSSAAKAAPRAPRNPSRVVGLGCSAGGLEACAEFFKALPGDTGMAFVVVSHLDPDHKAMMPELLARCTPMRVCQAEDGMRLQPNRVYVIPPNRDLSVLHARMLLQEPSAQRGLRMPIDYFFKHLAQDQRDRAIAIVLSGMGTDGTQGVKTVKEEMGLVMVQDPDSAKYDSMPNSAIGTGLADIMAAPRELADRLVKFVRHTAALPVLDAAEPERPSSALQKLFVLLRARTGTDFSGYKRTTIYRRVERRMGVHQLQPLPRYVRYLQENPHEVDLLFHELLIGVTGFFRDPAAFDALRDKALPKLLERKEPGETLRVWVPGCSTGEEAYSLAMVLTECLEQAAPRGELAIQIFATDLDKDAIDKARQGAFPANIAADMTPARLKRFCNRTDRGYTVKKDIRERVVFAPQNVLTDPPFTRMDLLSCRNLLIYLNPDWQKKLLALFHFALNPGGILFLGSAETVGGFADLYAPLDARWKIFRRKETPASLRDLAGLPGMPRPHEAALPPAPEGKALPPLAGVADVAQRILVDSYIPPAVVITPDGDIVYVVGRTGRFLEPASGKVNLNVFAMAREGLSAELGLAVRNAVQRRNTVVVRNLRVKTNGARQLVNLTVKPLAGMAEPVGLLLVVFEEAEPAAGHKAGRRGKTVLRPGAGAKALEEELNQTRTQLQGVVEQSQATQEELKAANEELQSNNEELQSTNEELTTSKEELQSLNEEMSTVNAELQTKLDEVALVSSDMRNLLNGIDVATIFADNDLRIKRFTPQATRIISFIPTDVGRPLRDLVTNLQYDRLVDDARHVLATLIFKETEVQTRDGRWQLMRIIPYRTAENVIDGVVFTFADITTQKQLEASLRRSENAAQEARLLAENILATVREPLLVLDVDLRIVSANRAFCAEFRMTPDQTENRMLTEVGEGQWDVPDLKRLLQEILPRQTELRDFRVEHDFPGLGHRVLLLNARRVERPDERPPLILLAIEEITEAERQQERKE